MTKQKELDKVYKEIFTCKTCKIASIGLAVVGEGNPNAKIVFIGEAPGRKEAETGRPFIGRSGNFLRKNIQKIGLDDLKDVYITSPVKYLPKRGTPDKKQIAHGMIHLKKQLDIINPEMIVLMGNTATVGVLGQIIPVSKHHGQVIEKDGKKYFLTFHPAAAIRFQKYVPFFEADFKKLKKLI